MSASVPDVSGGIDAEGAVPSVGVDVPSASASLDVPGESLHPQVGFGFALLDLPAFVVVARGGDCVLVHTRVGLVGLLNR